MVPAPVLAAAAAIALAFYGGKAVLTHVVKPTGCAIKHAVTLGHKRCEAKAKPVK